MSGKTNIVTRTITENKLIGTNDIKNIQTNQLKIVDINSKEELDTITKNGLTKTHVTILRAYPYIYDAIVNIINDKNLKSKIIKDDEDFYSITIEYSKFIKLALGYAKNNGQKKNLEDELKSFKTENKVIKTKDINTGEEYSVYSPTVFFVLTNKGGEIKKSNLTKDNHKEITTIRLSFSKPLFYSAIEGKNTSYFVVPKNLTANSKRILDNFHLDLENVFDDKTDINITENLFNKTISYLLLKNNINPKSNIKPSKMNIDLVDFAKHVYPKAIRPNTNNLRYKNVLLKIMKYSIIIYNTITVQENTDKTTLTLSPYNHTEIDKNIISIPILSHNDIQGEIYSIIQFLISNIAFKDKNELSLYLNAKKKDKNEIKKLLKNYQDTTLKIVREYEKVNGKVSMNNKVINLDVSPYTKNEMFEIVKKILKYI